MLRNLWLVAGFEYRHVVIRRSFLLVTLAIPLGLAVLIAVMVIYITSKFNLLPVGYVDGAGFLQIEKQQDLPNPADRIVIVAYPDEAQALAALFQEKIQAFFVFPRDYAQTLQTDLYYLENPPTSDVWSQFDDFVRLNLVARLPEALRERVLDGPQVTVIDVNSNRRFSENSVVNIIVPVAASFLFFFATMSASGYMLQAVADEKENRTLEVVITSLTPEQLIGGKVVGLVAASLTQLMIYLLAAIICIRVAAPTIGALQQVEMPWAYLGVMVLFFLPTYVLIASIMVAIGGSVDELQQGQQVAGILNLVFLLPIFMLVLMFENPSHPLIIFMTFFPPTAFLTISLRWGLSSIPTWQIVLSWVILVVTTAGSMWAAARIFRVGMLRYGQPLSLRSWLDAVKESPGR
jgi:ABC-2 type transport system permease protein